MTGIERIAVEAIAALFLVWGTVLYLEHRGAQQCRAADATAVAAQEARNAVQAADDTKTINLEAKTYAQAVAAPDDPSPALVCVRKYPAPRPVSAATTPGPSHDGSADLSKAASGSFDPSPGVKTIGKEVDARVVYLEGYITDVCRPK